MPEEDYYLNKLKDQPLSSTEIKEIALQARKKIHTNLEGCLQTILLLIPKARLLNNNELVALLLDHASVCYRHKGMIDIAIKYLKEGIQLLDDKPSNLLGHYYNNWGICCNKINKNLDGIKYLERALAIFEKENNKLAISRVINNLASGHFDIGLYSEAIKYLFKSIEIKKELGNEQGRIYSITNLGYLYGLVGKFEIAKQLLNESLAYLTKEVNKRHECITLMYLCKTYEVQNKYEKALEYAQKAKQISIEYKLYFHQIEAINYIIEIGFKRKQLDNLYPLIEQATHLCETHEIKSASYAYCLSFQIEYFTKKQEYDNAWAIKEKCLQFAEKDTTLEAKLRVLKSLVKVSEEKKLIKEGFEYAKQLIKVQSQRAKWQVNDQFAKTLTEFEVIQREEKITEQSKANEALNLFVFSASHDMKEPIRAINSFSEVLAKKLPEEDKEAQLYLSYIRNAGQQLQYLITDLLSDAVADHQKKSNIVDLNEVLAIAKTNLSVKIKNTEAIIDNLLLPKVIGAFTPMVQLFQNLLDNAIKYRQPNTTPHIKISSTYLKDYQIQICIEDNGIGIDPKYHQDIFQPFIRLHKKDKYPGNGIGLATCQNIIRRYGEKMEVKSTPNKGSQFLFILNLK